MTKKPTEPLPGELSRTELKKRCAVVRTRTQEQSGAPLEEHPSWRVLEDLIFYWLTLPPEVGEKRIERLMRRQGGDPTMMGAVSGLVEHFKELLSTGSVQRYLVDSWNRKNAEDKRMEATNQLSKKIGNPVYRGKKGRSKAGEPWGSSWSQHREEIVRRLMERYPYIKTDKDRLEEENRVILQSPMAPGKGLMASTPDPASEDGLGIISYYIQGLPTDQGEALKQIRRDIERVLLDDLLGEKYRSEYETVSADTPLNTEEDDGSTIVDTIADESDDSDPVQKTRSDEMSEKFKTITRRARLSVQEAKALWLKYEGYDPRDIAPILNTNARTVSVALTHAITKIIDNIGEKALRDMLKED